MMIFACLVVVSLMMCNDFSRQGRLVAWRGRGLRGSVSEVWTAGHGGVKGRGRGRANLSLWALCVLLICVLCEKKNVFEIRWGVFSLTELTDLTEPFAHSFELIREWPLPQPLPRRATLSTHLFNIITHWYSVKYLLMSCFFSIFVYAIKQHIWLPRRR